MEDEAATKSHVMWGVFSFICVGVVILTIVWCGYLGAGSLEKSSLAFSLCFASGAVGGLGGFLFSVFGDEQEQFGKMRDAMIALLSGAAGVGVAKAKEIGSLLGQVHVFAEDSKSNPSFSILLVIGYFIAGFFFMYFFRKLALNPALAGAQSAIDTIQNSRKVSDVANRVTEKLPQSMLLGRDFISEVEDLGIDEKERLEKSLFAEDVEEFLAECEKDAKSGVSIQPYSLAMAARLNYYRVYFREDGSQERDQLETKAVDWIQRALMRDPTNPDLQIKLADVFGMQGRYVEAISILDKLEREENAPQYIQQWLGYFLLFVEGREQDAIRHSRSFHERFPDESSALFNASCGYAQLYTLELETNDSNQVFESRNRIESLRLLGQAIRIDPELRKLAVKHSEPGDSFESFVDDEDFQRLTLVDFKKRYGTTE